MVVEHGTLTRAARHAHLSQPALTASIQRLESELGARLLHRGRHGARLTAAGEALLPRAHAAIAAIEDAKRAVAEIEGLHAGAVRMGGGVTATTYLLPPILAEFRRQHPRVTFYLEDGITEDLWSAVDAGALDLAIVTGDRGELWIEDELILIGPPNGLPISDFVTFRTGSPTRQLLRQAFPNAHIVMELSSIAAVKGNVRAGIGVALVSRHAVALDLQAGLLIEIPHPMLPLRRRLALAHRGVETLPPATAALRRLILDCHDRF